MEYNGVKRVRARQVVGVRDTLNSEKRPKSDLPILTVMVSRARLPLIPHDSHTLPLISADRRLYGNRLNFLS